MRVRELIETLSAMDDDSRIVTVTTDEGRVKTIHAIHGITMRSGVVVIIGDPN